MSLYATHDLARLLRARGMLEEAEVLGRRTLEAHVARSPTSLEEILEVDRTCRAEATRSLERRLAS